MLAAFFRIYKEAKMIQAQKLSLIQAERVSKTVEMRHLRNELRSQLLPDTSFENESEYWAHQQWIQSRLNVLSAELMMLEYEQERLELSS